MIIVVAHPSPTIATGMATALERELGCAASAVTSVEALWTCLVKTTPDLVVVDVLLDPGRAPGLCARLAERRHKSLVLTRADGTVPHYSLLEQGAVGIVLAGDGVAGLITAVRTIMAGNAHVPPHLLGRVLHELIVERRIQEGGPADRMGSLSPREHEVLALLGDGADTRVIASRLVISPHTAKTHVNRLLGKLGLASRAEAAAFAAHHGIRPALLETTHD